MDKILEDLYHGRIYPEEDYRPMSEEHDREQRMLAEQKAALLERLRKTDSDMCRELEDLLDRANVLEAMDLEEVYIQGMRMGARLALALLGEKAQ